jgi:hypothetical protein
MRPASGGALILPCAGAKKCRKIGFPARELPGILWTESTLRVNFDDMGMRTRPEREARKALSTLLAESVIGDQRCDGNARCGGTLPAHKADSKGISCSVLGREKLSKQYVNRLVNTLPPRHREPPLNRYAAPCCPAHSSGRIMA